MNIMKNVKIEYMGCGPRCFEEIGKPKKQCVLDGDQSYGEGGYKWEKILNIKII